MAILQKNSNGMFEQGQVGTWINPQTGLGYSGLRKSPNDIPAPTNVGQSQTLNRNPIIPVQQQQSSFSPMPIAPQPQASQSQGVQQNQDPITKFNLAILDMLQKAQNGSGNEDLYLRQRELQRKQVDSGIDFSGTEGLSPNAQENVASARAGEYSPEIDAISAKIKAADSRLQNFESILTQMRGIGADIAKLNPSKEVLEGYKNMIEAGGSPTSVPQEVMDKVAGLVDWDKWNRSVAAQKAAERAPQQGPSEWQLYQLAKNDPGFADFIKQGSNPAIIKKIETSPEGKKLSSLKDLKNKLNAYNSSVSDYGFEAYGANKAVLDSQYAALKIAYKEAANLGALTGPDISILQEAIKPSTGGAMAYGNYYLGGGKEGVLKSLNTALEAVNTEAATNAQRLLSKYPGMENDPYIQDLVSGFIDSGEWEYIPDNQSNWWEQQ